MNCLSGFCVVVPIVPSKFNSRIICGFAGLAEGLGFVPGVGLTLGFGDTLGVVEDVGLGLRVGVGDGLLVGVGLGLLVGVGLGFELGESVGLGDALIVVIVTATMDVGAAKISSGLAPAVEFATTLESVVLLASIYLYEIVVFPLIFGFA